MYNPCFECYSRRGRQYTEECDNMCDYAKVALEKRRLEKYLGDLHSRLKEVNSKGEVK